jgi:hypothetical protein
VDVREAVIATDAFSALPVVLASMLILVLMVLVYKYLTRTRDMRVGKTRFGFFVEREPFEDEEVEAVTESWPKRGLDD